MPGVRISEKKNSRQDHNKTGLYKEARLDGIVSLGKETGMQNGKLE